MCWKTFDQLIDSAEEFENACFANALWPFFRSQANLRTRVVPSIHQLTISSQSLSQVRSRAHETRSP
jgi:hypothetical protein